MRWGSGWELTLRYFLSWWILSCLSMDFWKSTTVFKGISKTLPNEPLCVVSSTQASNQRRSEECFSLTPAAMSAQSQPVLLHRQRCPAAIFPEVWKVKLVCQSYDRASVRGVHREIRHQLNLIMQQVTWQGKIFLSDPGGFVSCFPPDHPSIQLFLIKCWLPMSDGISQLSHLFCLCHMWTSSMPSSRRKTYKHVINPNPISFPLFFIIIINIMTSLYFSQNCYSAISWVNKAATLCH